MKSFPGSPTHIDDMGGVIFNILKFSTEDGPGIRTTLFLKGCPLRCRWCHNPESLKLEPQLVWYPVRCIHDGLCIKTCPRQSLSSGADGRIETDRQTCQICGTCARECPTNALEIIGSQMSVDQVMAEVRKDTLFYRQSGGGVTISGGEPTFQPEFLLSLLKACKAEAIHTALDTSGCCSQKVLEAILPYTDLVLFDLKCLEESIHKEITGVSLEPILKNLRLIEARGISLWIRTPIIPNYTDSEKNIQAIAQLIQGELQHVERYDLLAFSNLGLHKYQQLGMKWELEKEGPVKKADMERFQQIAIQCGLSNVTISGPMK